MQLFRLKTALRSSIVWCEERTALGDDATEKLGQGALWKSSCLCTPISRQTNQNPTATKGGEKFIYFHFFFFEDRQGIPNATSLHIDLYGPIRARCQFHPSADGRTNSQQSPLHASPSLIVNSVNEVNLINFRAGSLMTFSSIFSPTSKTSISSSKMGRSEWQSPITQPYLKPRVNLFSSFECVHYNCVFKEDLQIAKKLNLSPRNVQKLFFFFFPFFFFNPVSISQPQWVTQSIVVLHFLFLIRTDHNSHRSWNPIL